MRQSIFRNLPNLDFTEFYIKRILDFTLDEYNYKRIKNTKMKFKGVNNYVYKKILLSALSAVCAMTMLAGCGSTASSNTTAADNTACFVFKDS